MKSSLDNLTTHINNFIRMLCKDYPDFSPTPSPSSLPTPRSSSLRKKNETESPTTRREGYAGRHLTRDLFTQNYRTLSDWNIEGRTSTVEVPAWMPVSFRPPRDMILNELEAAVAAYIFQSKIPESHIDEEVLVECMWGYGDRGSLKSLIPKGCMDQEVLNMLVARLTFNEKSITGYSTSWFLPTTFSIYIPINDMDHWYMMVVNMINQTVYYLDTYLSAQEMLKRLAFMKRVLETLFEIMSAEKFVDISLYTPFDLGSWEIKEAIGVPNIGCSKNSSIWILQWMSMEDYFQPEVLGVLNEINVRVKIALSLLMGPFNKLKRHIETNAVRAWHESAN